MKCIIIANYNGGEDKVDKFSSLNQRGTSSTVDKFSNTELTINIFIAEHSFNVYFILKIFLLLKSLHSNSLMFMI